MPYAIVHFQTSNHMIVHSTLYAESPVTSIEHIHLYIYLSYNLPHNVYTPGFKLLTLDPVHLPKVSLALAFSL
jgi:hypothetical protein